MAIPRKNRLKGTRELSRMFSGTRPVVSEHLSLRVVRDPAGSEKLFSVVVPAKYVALASARNALRRRTSEALSHIIKEFPFLSGVRAVVMVKTTRFPGQAALRHELLSLMKKSGILN